MNSKGEIKIVEYYVKKENFKSENKTKTIFANENINSIKDIQLQQKKESFQVLKTHNSLSEGKFDWNLASENKTYSNENQIEEFSSHEYREIHNFTPGKNSTRADVVRKSLIRGIKRYFCELMWQGKNLINQVESEEGLLCLSKIDEVFYNNF